MPVPAILGLIGALGVGAGMGFADQKVKQNEAARKMALEAIQTLMLSGQGVPPEWVKNILGKEFADFPNMVSGAVRAGQERDAARAHALIQGYRGGSPASENDPNASMSPSGVPLSTAGPLMPGDPQFQAPGRPPIALPPAEVAAPSTELPQTAQAPGPNLLNQPALTPTPTVSTKLGNVNLSFPGTTHEEARRENQQVAGRQFMAEMTKGRRSYADMLREAGQRGFLNDPNIQKGLEAYGKAQYDQAFNGAVVGLTGGTRAPSPQEYEGAQWQAYAQTGFNPPPAPNQETVDQRYMTTFAQAWMQNLGRPIPELDAAVRQAIGGVPSPKAIEQATVQVKQLLTQAVIAGNPGIQNNPERLAMMVDKLMGGVGRTAEEQKALTTRAPIDPAVERRMAEQGIPAPLQSQLGGSQAAPGASTGEVRRQMEAEDIARDAAKTKATTTASKQAAQATAGGELVPDKELFENYSTPNGDPPQAGMTRDALNAEINSGKLGVLHTDKRTYRNLGTLDGIIKGYTKAYADVAPLLDRGVVARAVGRLAAAPTPVEIMGIKIPLLGTIPPLTDAQLKSFGITRKEADALAAWVHYNNTALLTLRSIGEGERGNVAQRIIGRGEETFPNLTDNSRTAGAKLDLLIRRLAVERAGAATFNGREWAFHVDPKTKAFDIGLVPRGVKLPQGWEFVR